VRDAAAAVVSDHGEAREPERAHDRGLTGGHGGLAAARFHLSSSTSPPFGARPDQQAWWEHDKRGGSAETQSFARLAGSSDFRGLACADYTCEMRAHEGA
jgi:hypothetical protein